jgi:hypothetical protein
VLYHDTFWWMADGSVLTAEPPVDPANPVLVKIEEDVYDDHQGRGVLSNALGLGIAPPVAHGSPIPAPAFELYVYTITNLGYLPGSTNGVGGFNIQNLFNVAMLGQWAPNAAASWWNPSSLFAGANFEWDIDADNDWKYGDGAGIVQGQAHDSFMFAVPAGTPHGILPAHIHSWSGGGLSEQPLSMQTNIVNGFVSGPLPEPLTMLGVFLGLAGLGRYIRRRQRA